MFSRTALLLLGLTLSQVYATSPMQQRSIEFLETRQSVCDSVCDPFDTLITTCARDLTCLCNTAAATSLQACVTCAVTRSTGDNSEVIAAAQKLIDTYAQGCASVAGVPAVTIPETSGSTSTTLTSRISSPRLSASSTSVRRSTVTSGTTPPVVVQSTFTSVASSTEDTLPTGTNGLPAGIVSNDGRHSYNGKQAGLVAIGGMLGVALVL